MELKLTKELFDFINNECVKFQEETWPGNDVDVADVLYSYLNSTDESFALLEDWNEGKSNDPFWNEERNEHSAIVFLMDIVDKIKIFHTSQNNPERELSDPHI